MNTRFAIATAFAIVALIVASAIKAFGQPASTTPIVVAWDYSTSTDVSKYRVRGGGSPGRIEWIQEVGLTNRASLVLTRLPAYLTVTAISSNGLESGPSNELAIERPEAPKNATWIAVVVTVTNWIGISP